MVNVPARQLGIAALCVAVSFSVASASAEVVSSNTGDTTVIEQQSSESLVYQSSTTVTNTSPSEVVKLTTDSTSSVNEMASSSTSDALTRYEASSATPVSADPGKTAPEVGRSTQQAGAIAAPATSSSQSGFIGAAILSSPQSFGASFYVATPPAMLDRALPLAGASGLKYPLPLQSSGAVEAFGQLIGFINGVSASALLAVEQQGVMNDIQVVNYPALVVLITALFIILTLMLFLPAGYVIRLRLSGFLAAPRSDVATNQFFATPPQWVLLSRSAGS